MIARRDLLAGAGAQLAAPPFIQALGLLMPVTPEPQMVPHVAVVDAYEFAEPKLVRGSGLPLWHRRILKATWDEIVVAAGVLETPTGEPLTERQVFWLWPDIE